ncbi:unnamed protein product, partial [marine sediment metagenome]
SIDEADEDKESEAQISPRPKQKVSKARGLVKVSGFK